MCLVPPICVDNKICKQYDVNSGWDKSAVKDFITFFVKWLSKQLKKAEKNKFSEYFQGIQKNNQKRGTEKIRGLHQLWLQAQLYAMEKLAEYGERKKCWSHDECLYLAAKWKNLLLPGVCPQPMATSPLMEKQTIVIPEMNGRRVFEKALDAMLTDSSRFCFVPERGDFPETYHGTKVLGYVRQYKDKKTHTHFIAVQMKEDVFAKEAPKYCRLQCDWNKIIKAVRKKKPKYLHPTEVSRMPTKKDKQRECRALIINIDAARFLSDEAGDTLLNLIISQIKTETVPNREDDMNSSEKYMVWTR